MTQNLSKAQRVLKRYKIAVFIVGKIGTSVHLYFFEMCWTLPSIVIKRVDLLGLKILRERMF